MDIMKKYFILPFMIIVSIGCISSLYPEQPPPTDAKNAWSIYDPDPGHIWNRVFRQLYLRTTAEGGEYGSDELDPLLWFDTTYLLNGTSHQQAIEVLDEFLSANAENLIVDPLKRAMFQRDMWAVFDWAASQAEPYTAQRRGLETRLAQIIRRVALSKDEILSLPDNYSFTIDSKTFLPTLDTDHPERGFLPADLFQADSAWVPMGREGGPVAMSHVSGFPFFGRSAFLVFVRSPNGRTATLDFIQSLQIDANPVLAIGSDVALVRRMLLIDDHGDMVLSPLVETVQLRHLSPEQNFHQFELSRARLLNGLGGGLVLKADLFLLFMSHGDVFEGDHGPELQATIPHMCTGCHFEYPPIPNSGNTRSIISYSREPIPLADNSQPTLFATTLDDEAQVVIEWKLNHETWKSLETLWNTDSR